MASGENDLNKMEVFTARDAFVDRRRAFPGPIRPVPLEKPPDLLAWWRVVRKRRWTVLGTFSLLFIGVLVGSIKMRPVYRAKALIEIDKENQSIINPQEMLQLDEVSVVA